MTQFEPGLILGALLIVIYATERFNTPRTNRASTTAAQYYSAAAIYLLIYLLTYFVFSKYPHLLKVLIDDAELQQRMQQLDAENTPILVAMILSLLVPKLPLVRELDLRLRVFLHRLASIPFEAIRMSKEVQGMRYEIPPSLLPELRQEMEDRNFPVALDAPESTDPIVRNWMNIAALMLQLRHWEKTHPYAAFMQERAGQLQRIHERYHRLCASAISAYDLARQAHSQSGIPALQDAVTRFHRNFRADEKTLYAEICDFISQAILIHCFRGHTRRSALQKLGFKPTMTETPQGISVHQGVMLAGMLLMLLLTSFILFSQNVANIQQVLVRAAMIVSIYSAAVFFVVYPKEKWRFFQYDGGRFYPVAGYLVSGLMAMPVCMAINLIFRTLISVSAEGDTDITHAFSAAVSRYVDFSYPWMTLSFVAAICLAFLIDWKIPIRLGQRMQKVCKAGVMIIVLMSCTWLVHAWLVQIYLAKGMIFPLPLASALRNAALIGYVLGYFVPAWFIRSCEHQRSLPASRLTPAAT